MSSPDLNYHASTNTSLVGKILEQGLRLRNSMVQTILCNDPFSKDFLRSDGLRSVEEGGRKSGRSGFEFDETGILEDLGIVRGDSSRNKVYSIKNCSCDICREYNKAYGTVDGADVYRSTHPSLKNVPDDVSEIPQKVSTLSLIKSTFDENYSLLKYVDSLKVTVNFFKINTAGKRKLSDIDKTLYQSSVTFYIEYSLPEIVQRFLPKSKAKVNSGLQPKSKIRYCSKRLQNNSVLFKQSSVHLLSNIDKLDLSSINIDVTITCRTLKQKSAEPFGRSNFNLGAIITNPNLTVTQELPILGAKQPVVLGTLNVVLQFGCDKLHFGKEFIGNFDVGCFYVGFNVFCLFRCDRCVAGDEYRSRIGLEAARCLPQEETTASACEYGAQCCYSARCQNCIRTGNATGKGKRRLRGFCKYVC